MSIRICLRGILSRLDQSARAPRYPWITGLRSFCANSADGKIKKLLVANRGEIACRIIATAQRLGNINATVECSKSLCTGIPCVAIFSAADRHARHVAMADEAAYIGEAPASESYLNAAAILNVAKNLGATAIHPGYGFLSEDYRFAEQCEKESVMFVGPSAAVIRTMGDKSEAKQLMRQAGVPVVPGYDGGNQDLDHLIQQGREVVGYPLLVKATVGGGGKGMKLATTEDELQDAISSAQREALTSFGDSRVLLERFIQVPRHIEVQVIADVHGTVLHLFERDCSIQRRHQKIIEESPAPNIAEAFRKTICASAVEAARAVGYTNAGTVEFILDTETGEYFFMEMNTRLQVEHPVTEGVCGLDLVELQFAVAAGRRLNKTQEELVQSGHCIEARLYAELPHLDFLPGAGRLERWNLPQNTEQFCLPSRQTWTRVDSGVRTADEIGVFYDPMIAKVISKGTSREEAILELRNSLTDIQICGLPTNLDFLKRILDHQNFKKANLNTAFVSDHLVELFLHHEIDSRVIALAAVVRSMVLQNRFTSHHGSQAVGPWASIAWWRLNHDCFQELALCTAEKECYDLTLRFVKDGVIRVTCGDRGHTIDGINASVEAFEAQVDGVVCRGQYCLFRRTHDVGISIWSTFGHCTLYTQLQDFSSGQPGEQETSRVLAPMHGRVVKVSASEGNRVTRGDSLLILEAMKMEHVIKASMDGVVESVSVAAGSRVHDGQVLINIRAANERDADR